MKRHVGCLCSLKYNYGKSPLLLGEGGRAEVVPYIKAGCMSDILKRTPDLWAWLEFCVTPKRYQF